MTLRPMLAGARVWVAVLLLFLGPVPWRMAGLPTAHQLLRAQPQGTSAGEPEASYYQLLSNPSLESYDPPYAQFEGIDCQVASAWQRFWYDGPEPHWMDTRVFASSHLGCGWVESIAGDTSQMILSTEPYTAGLWQQVGGLTPGVGYGFHTAMLTVFQTSDQPAVPGTMIKEVGLDPTGGTDPLSPQILWSEPNGQDHGWVVALSTAAYAESATMTVFVRVRSPNPSGGLPLLNQSFLDSAILAQTAQVSATSPPVSDAEHFEVRWDNASPSPEAEIRAYDVQWQDEAQGVWHEWLTWTADVAAMFYGEWGHRYRFRARAWQRYPSGAHLPSPYREEGDTQTGVGLELTGRVLDPRERGVSGATLTILETGRTTVSGPGGGFGLILAPGAEPISLSVGHTYWLSPPPVYGLSVTPTTTQDLTYTMRPRDDAVTNGGFEAGLEGWSAMQGGAHDVAEPVHSGRGAAVVVHGVGEVLGSTPSLATAVALSQTVALTDAWAPVLSFWYLAEGDGEQDDFQVVLTVVAQPPAMAQSPSRTGRPARTGTTTRELSPPLQADGRWHHFWAYVDQPRAAFAGTVTAGFLLWDHAGGEPLAVYLDDVNLGSIPGGPWGVYLPLIAR